MIRLLVFETRKLVDTRSSLVMIGICVAAGTALALVGLANRPSGIPIPLSELGAAAAVPFAIISPLIGVLAATSDWSTGAIQQTVLIEVRRSLVFMAKLAAGACASTVLAIFSSALAISGGFASAAIRNQEVVAGPFGGMFWGLLCIVIPGSLLGFGIGSIVFSTAGGICLVLGVQLIVDVAVGAVPGGWGTYIRSSSFSEWLTTGNEPFSGVSSLVLWFCIPLIIGAIRYRRNEIKT